MKCDIGMDRKKAIKLIKDINGSVFLGDIHSLAIEPTDKLIDIQEIDLEEMLEEFVKENPQIAIEYKKKEKLGW